MNECKGLFGKIFGHCFKSKILKYTPPKFQEQYYEGYNIVQFIEANATKEYEIICKRCGVKRK